MKLASNWSTLSREMGYTVHGNGGRRRFNPNNFGFKPCKTGTLHSLDSNAPVPLYQHGMPPDSLPPSGRADTPNTIVNGPVSGLLGRLLYGAIDVAYDVPHPIGQSLGADFDFRLLAEPAEFVRERYDMGRLIAPTPCITGTVSDSQWSTEKTEVQRTRPKHRPGHGPTDPSGGPFCPGARPLGRPLCRPLLKTWWRTCASGRTQGQGHRH